MSILLHGTRWSWLVLAVGALAVGSAAFLMTKQLTHNAVSGAQAPPGASTTTAQPPVPPDSATPEAGKTPDLTEPGWYVPYLNRDAELPRFEETINGISIGRTLSAEAEGYCEGGAWESGPDAETRYSSSAVAFDGSDLPAGTTFFQRPKYVVCPRAGATRMEAVIAVKPTRPAPRIGLGVGSVEVIRFVGEPYTPMPAAAERWSGGTVAGYPAAILRPVIESVGTSAIVVHDPKSRVTTLVRGDGVYLHSLDALVQELFK